MDVREAVGYEGEGARRCGRWRGEPVEALREEGLEKEVVIFEEKLWQIG